MVNRVVAVAYAVGAAIVSAILTFVVGTAYLDHRIEKGIAESKVIDARVDNAFLGICGILISSSRPYPQPPTRDAPHVSPTTPYGKELEEYNKAVADRQAEGLRLLSEAIDTYNCQEDK